MHISASLLTLRRLRAMAAVAAVTIALPAFASLGGDVTSVESDRAHMAASVRVTQPSSNYSVHEIQSPEGTVVQEYVSPAGKVFAVTWRGQFMPQMQQVLGITLRNIQRLCRLSRAATAAVLSIFSDRI